MLNFSWFANPILLAGLGGALIPLVLHLLARSRYRTVQWGAMMFLTGVESAEQRSSRVKQYMLLMMRMTAVALLAVAMARPVWPGGASADAAKRKVAGVVLILDCSASMGTIEAGRTRMEPAREAALRLLAMLDNRDRAALLTPGTIQNPISPRLSSDLRTLSARVVAARPGTGTADLADALNRAAHLLADETSEHNGHIFIVADSQAGNWSKVSAAFARNWKAQFRDNPPPITVVPIGNQVDNVTIESVRIVAPPVVRGELALVEVKLRSWGHSAHPSIPVSLQADGRPIGQKTIALAANDTAVAQFGMTLAGVGSHRLTATIQTTGMSNDDTLDAAVEVVQPLQMLIVSGDESDDNQRPGESTFVAIAAAPNTAAARQGVDPAVVRIVRSEQFNASSLVGQQVLVLANVGQIDADDVKAIEQFVYEGGGLLVAPGGLVNADHYNTLLYRQGSGILPAELSSPTPASRSEATTILGLDLSHPVFAFLRGRPDPIPSANIGRYFPASPRQPDAKVTATLASGKPLLVEGQWGRGRVLLLTTPLDADWSTLPFSSFYVPFVQSMIRYLAIGLDHGHTLSVGQPIQLRIDEAVSSNAIIRTPSGARVAPIVRRIGAGSEIRFDATTVPGAYRLRYRTGPGDKDSHTVQFVVQPPRDESDVTSLSPARWNELAATMGVERVATSQLSPEMMGATAPQELWLPLLALACAFLLGDLLLARQFSSRGAA
jgi:Mg-chelatase subunit ChlD/uncharacterized membrane protein